MNVPLKENSNITSASEIIVRCLKQPTVSNVSANDGIVELTIDKELGVEVVGDVKVKISVEDDEDDYEEIFDEPKVEDIPQVNEDYLSE